MRWLGLALAVLLGGCASAFPTEVMRTVDTRISADDLRRDPAAYKGARVIVGGDILSTQPKPGETEIELLARRLRDDDSPGAERSLPRAAPAPLGRLPGPRGVRGGPADQRHRHRDRRGGAQGGRAALPVPGDRGGADPPLAAGGRGVRSRYYPWGVWPYGPYYYDPYYFGPRSRFGPYGWWW